MRVHPSLHDRPSRTPRFARPASASGRLLFLVLSVPLLLAGCATAYQPSGFTGGFDETRLSDTMFEVRFLGNGYTTSARSSQFVLRRCAELALENGYRYFELIGDTDNDYSQEGWVSRPRTFARIRLVPEETESSADAVYVIRDTDAAAQGRLSAGARRTLLDIERGDETR